MSKENYKLVKSDIKELSIVLKESEHNIYQRIREVETGARDNASDLRLISSNMSQIATKIGDLVSAFKKHDEIESAEYKNIREEQMKVDNELKNQKSEIQSIKNTQDVMKKNQDTFFKYIYIGSGIIMTFSLLAFAMKSYTDYNKAVEIRNKSSYEQFEKRKTTRELYLEIDRLKKERG